jgi:HEAT repeat protein
MKPMKNEAHDSVLATAEELAQRIVLRGSGNEQSPHLAVDGERAAEARLLARLADNQKFNADELARGMRRSSNHLSRCAAAYALYRLRPRRIHRVVDALVGELMVNMSTQVQVPAKLLMAIGEPAVRPLSKMLGRPMVLGVLGHFGGKAAGAVPALIKRLEAGGTDAVMPLVKIGTNEAVCAALPALVQALDADYYLHRKMALVGLAVLGERALDARDRVRELLGDANDDVRVRAAVALFAMGDGEVATEAAGRMLSEPDLHERYLLER